MKSFLLSLALLVPLSATADELRIGRITIHALDVYSNDEATRGYFYRTADRLHIETRRQVIEKFLLFHEGDVYRAERLAETERNLRALHFLKSAAVAASPPHDGLVDVTVTTQDAWSIAPETSAGNKGGVSTVGVSISETNLLGLGKEVAVGWDKGVDRTRISVDYQDPAFFAPYWNARMTYSRNSDGYDHRFIIRRPFYSFATPWSAELSFQGFRQQDKLYDNGSVRERFFQTHKMIVVAAGRAFAANDTTANRITTGVRLVDDDFTNTIPSRELRYVFARYDHLTNDFLKLNFINKDIRYEDFNLGTQSSFEAAAGQHGAYSRVAASRGWRTSENGFVMPFASVESRFEGGPANTIANGYLLYVNRVDDSSHPRATVGRIVVTSGWRLDRETQFFADGLTGLRGYRLHAFEGSRTMIVNLEHRLYLGRELLQLYSPGVVAFVDSGNATNGGGSDLLHFKTDVGVGIRIGLPRTPKNLLRFDVAYPLNRDGRGRKGLLVSFSSGQAF